MSHFLKLNLKKQETYILLFLLLFSVIVVLIYFPENRLYSGHDAAFHYARIRALMEALSDGSFPVYIDSSAVHGYGYGTKLFYSDFVLLPVALLALITNIVFAFKAYLVCILFLAGYFWFLAVRKLFGSNYIALLSAFLINFSYYRLLTLTSRGALGESLSYVFIPLVVLGAYEMIKGNYKKWYIFSVGFGL